MLVLRCIGYVSLFFKCYHKFFIYILMCTGFLCICSANQLMPYVYLLCLLVFLVFFSFLLTLRLLQVVKLELRFYQLNAKDARNYCIDDLFDFLKISMRKRLWFSSVRLIESVNVLPKGNVDRYFNAIGYLYYNMRKHDLAKFYCSQVLSIKETRIGVTKA